MKTKLYSPVAERTGAMTECRPGKCGRITLSQWPITDGSDGRQTGALE